MKKHLLFYFLLTFFMCYATNVLAQEDTEAPTRELGLASSNLTNDFSLIYKKELSENRYRVFDGELNLNVVFVESSSSSFFTSFSLGTENRKYLNEKIKFVRGPNYGLGLFVAEAGVSFMPFFRYQLGVQYDVNEMIYLGVSTFPTASLRIQTAEETPISSLNINGSFNAQLSAIFRF